MWFYVFTTKDPEQKPQFTSPYPVPSSAWGRNSFPTPEGAFHCFSELLASDLEGMTLIPATSHLAANSPSVCWRCQQNSIIWKNKWDWSSQTGRRSISNSVWRCCSWASRTRSETREQLWQSSNRYGNEVDFWENVEISLSLTVKKLNVQQSSSALTSPQMKQSHLVGFPRYYTQYKVKARLTPCTFHIILLVR